MAVAVAVGSGVSVNVAVFVGVGVKVAVSVLVGVGVAVVQGFGLLASMSCCTPPTEITRVLGSGCVAVVTTIWPGLPPGTVCVPDNPAPTICQLNVIGKVLKFSIRQ